MTTLSIGDVAIDGILEWSGSYRDPLEMYPDATRDAVERHRGWLEPHSLDPEFQFLNLVEYQFDPVHTIKHQYPILNVLDTVVVLDHNDLAGYGCVLGEAGGVPGRGEG